MENSNPPSDSTAASSNPYTTYDLFILAISFLALVIMMLFILPGENGTIQAIAFALDSVFSVIFLFDFFRSLARASDRREYFFRRGGWLDLFGSFPVFPILRLLRISRMFRIYRRMSGTTSRDFWRIFKENRAESAFWTTLLITLLVLSATSLLIVPIEAQSPNAEITDAGQAMWWSIVTITTVGYGDLVPVTEEGRILASGLMTIGVILVSVLTSYVTSNLMLRGDKTEQERKKRLEQGIRLLNERFDRLEGKIDELRVDREKE